MPVLAFGSFGSAAKELLTGGKAEPGYQFDKKVSCSVKNADGVTLTPTVVIKGEAVDLSLKSAYSYKSYSVDALVNTSEKVAVNASAADLAPGLKLSGSIALPDTASGKLGVEYSAALVNLKANAGLTSAPAVDLTASTGYNNCIVGGEAGYDTAKSLISKWSLGAAYHAPDSQFAAILGDKGTSLKLMAHHKYSPSKAVGAEAVRDLSSGSTSFTLGHSQRLANSAIIKAKISNSGTLSGAYEQRLGSGEKVVLSAQMNALKLSSPIKYGFAAELN